LAESGLMHPI